MREGNAISMTTPTKGLESPNPKTLVANSGTFFILLYFYRYIYCIFINISSLCTNNIVYSISLTF
jgi:hypothetical protein